MKYRVDERIDALCGGLRREVRRGQDAGDDSVHSRRDYRPSASGRERERFRRMGKCRKTSHVTNQQLWLVPVPGSEAKYHQFEDNEWKESDLGGGCHALSVVTSRDYASGRASADNEYSGSNTHVIAAYCVVFY